MKSIILSLLAIATISLTSFGQAPEGFKYQAVIRDASSLILTSQPVGIQLMIRQGSAGGPSVYAETFSPTTNGYGLVNLEIGTGTTTDDFTLIDWANGPYFIETAVDITGGVAYQVMGTNQLMSVPYALYAKTAENVVNDAVDDADNDPNNEIQAVSFSNDTLYLSNGGQVYLGAYSVDLVDDADNDPNNEIQDISLSVTDLTISSGSTVDLSSLQDGTGTDDQNISGSGLSGTDLTIGIEGGTSETIDLTSLQDVYTGGDGIDVAGTVISETKYQVGDFAQGGVVFWVDESGEHGLVCAKSDQSTGIRWHAGTYAFTRAYGDGPYAGESNTAIIIAVQTAIGDDGATYAARICNTLQITEGGKTYGDWYLPSKEELNQMYVNKAIINLVASGNGGGGFNSFWYWSSTENDYDNAWVRNFGDGNQGNASKGQVTYSVRSVRAF